MIKITFFKPKTDCFTKNVVHSLECITCEVANDGVGKKAVTCYIGETSRSLHRIIVLVLNTGLGSRGGRRIVPCISMLLMLTVERLERSNSG